MATVAWAAWIFAATFVIECSGALRSLDSITAELRGTASLAAHDVGGRSQKMIDSLISDKFGDDYDKDARPIPDFSRYDKSHRIQVFMSLNFLKLLNLDQVSQTLSMVVQLRLTWPDYRLAYNASTYFKDVPFFGEGDDFYWNSSSDFLPIEQGLAWIPDIQLLNSVTEPEDINHKPRLFWYDEEKLHSEGYNMVLVLPQKVMTSCPMSLQDFPFDTQRCHLRYGDWSASDRYFGFDSSDTEWHFPQHNEAFHVTDISVEKKLAKYDVQDVARFPEVVYSLQFERYPHYYVLHFVMPQLIIILVAQAVFWMDVHGERHTMASAGLIAVMTVSFLIAPMLPETNKVMWLERFQMICYVLTVIPVFTSIMVEYLGHKGPKGEAWANRMDARGRAFFPLLTLAAMVYLLHGVHLPWDFHMAIFALFNFAVYFYFAFTGLREWFHGEAQQDV